MSCFLAGRNIDISITAKLLVCYFFLYFLCFFFLKDWVEHSEVDDIVADSRTGQVLLKSPTTKGIVAFHKAKEAIEKLGANVIVQNASRNGNSHLLLGKYLIEFSLGSFTNYFDGVGGHRRSASPIVLIQTVSHGEGVERQILLLT